MTTFVTNSTLIWVFNFFLIYWFLYRRGYHLISGLFLLLNATLVSGIIEGFVSVIVIMVSGLIAVALSLKSLARAGV